VTFYPVLSAGASRMVRISCCVPGIVDFTHYCKIFMTFWKNRNVLIKDSLRKTYVPYLLLSPFTSDFSSEVRIHFTPDAATLQSGAGHDKHTCENCLCRITSLSKIINRPHIRGSTVCSE
jgi:hypothetical protein